MLDAARARAYRAVHRTPSDPGMTAVEPSIEAAPPELPVHLTRFIGRDRELAEISRLVESTRLLTLTGAGGSGKTRLAREAAARCASSFSRTAWVDLAPHADAQLVAEEVATALHAPEHTGVGARERAVGAIGAARVLLVLDNCEHVVEYCADLVGALLRSCSNLTVLATSRQALGVDSETAWLVPPLASTEAAQLFVERARSVVPAFAPTGSAALAIEEICQRLDGMPLAIELAAARVRVLAPEQIAERLDNAFRLLAGASRTALPRHRTLRATMDWSFGLLGVREQVLLRRLSVFAGGFSLDAAEAVCTGDPLETEDILDDVAALVDKSLVVMESGEGIARYRLLETVRQYGAEQLRNAGECDALERRHAEYFLALVEETNPHLIGGEDQPGILARLFMDDDNLRTASAWALGAPDRATEALRFAAALFWYWYGSSVFLRRGHFREARPYVSEALARGSECNDALRAAALSSKGLIALATGEYAEATEAFAEALALRRAEGDAAQVAFVLSKFGAARLMSGDLDEASALLEEANQIVEPMPRTVLHAFVWFWLGWTAHARGDTDIARAMSDRHLQLGELIGHRTTRGHSHALCGRVEFAAGRLQEAYAHFTAALPFHLELRDGWGIILDLEGFAAVAARRGHYAEAARLLGASDSLREQTIFAIPAQERAQRAERLDLLRERLGAAVLEELLAQGRALTMEDVVRLTTDDAMAHTAEHPIVVKAQARHEPASEGVPRLRVLALGSLQVFVGDRLVAPSEWGSARPRELLVYLLMHPEGRTREQAGLAFWPDASPAQLRNNFHVTTHRLRKALGGATWIVLSGDRYRVDPSLIAEVDATEFERDVTASRRALVRQQEGAAALLEHALLRYRGDFLDGEPVGDWHLEHRERLRHLYFGALMELGAHYAKADRHPKAVDAYRRVLARDDLHEPALRAVMQSLVQIGERSEALRLYRRFAERLGDELGAAPAPETARLLDQLRSVPTSPGATINDRRGVAR